MSEYFPNLKSLGVKLNQIYLIMQQRQIFKNATDVDVDKLDKQKNAPSHLTNLKSKVDR